MNPSSASMSNKLLLLTGGQADKIEGKLFNSSSSEITSFFALNAFINLFATQMSTKWQNKKNMIVFDIFDNLFSIWGAQWIYFGTWCHKKLFTPFTKVSLKTAYFFRTLCVKK